MPARRYNHYDSSASDVGTQDESASTSGEQASVSSGRESGTMDHSEAATQMVPSEGALDAARLSTKDTHVGTGEVTAKMGDVVHARYIICLRDGTEVVSRKDVPVCTTIQVGLMTLMSSAGCLKARRQRYPSRYALRVTSLAHISIPDSVSVVDKGLIGVRVGTERVISIPSELGYGDKKHGKIPANSSLFFRR